MVFISHVMQVIQKFDWFKIHDDETHQKNIEDTSGESQFVMKVIKFHHEKSLSTNFNTKERVLIEESENQVSGQKVQSRRIGGP